MSFLTGKSVLVTGGTGSFGKQFIRALLDEHHPKRVVVFSRDELKQFEMANMPAFRNREELRFFIGDVRDADRLQRAFHGVDVVVHAAAMKQVPACEYNPFEAVKTNIHGAENVINAALNQGVTRVLALSTDKACNPVNLYGATKLASDKIFIAGNAYAGAENTAFSVVRYGNVAGSRGSVIPFFLERRASGRLPITHPDMTRFWLTLEQGVRFVIESINRMHGGELFVPKIPSLKVIDLARAIGPECELDDIGIRPGEKLHEVMISEDDARHTVEHDGYYVILPEFGWWKKGHDGGTPCAEGFRYSSDSNTAWLDATELASMIDPFVKAHRGV